MGGSSSKDINESCTSYSNGTGSKPDTNGENSERQAIENVATLHTEPIQSLCVASEGEMFSGGVDKVCVCTKMAVVCMFLYHLSGWKLLAFYATDLICKFYVLLLIALLGCSSVFLDETYPKSKIQRSS